MKTLGIDWLALRDCIKTALHTATQAIVASNKPNTAIDRKVSVRTEMTTGIKETAMSCNQASPTHREKVHRTWVQLWQQNRRIMCCIFLGTIMSEGMTLDANIAVMMCTLKRNRGTTTLMIVKSSMRSKTLAPLASILTLSLPVKMSILIIMYTVMYTAPVITADQNKDLMYDLISFFSLICFPRLFKAMGAVVMRSIATAILKNT